MADIAILSSSAETMDALDLVSDGFMLLDTELHFLFLNQTAAALSGMDRASLIGHSLFEAFPILKDSPLGDACRTTLERGEPQDFQTDAPSGRTYDVHTRPAARGIYVIFRDVTDQRDRERALQAALVAEQAARITTESAQRENKRRQEADRFLAEAGRVLASSLDFEVTLQSVARLAVPRLADWCVIHAVEADGSVRELALEHQDPERVRWAKELQKRYPPRLEEDRGLGKVLKTGQAEVYRELTDEMLQAGARDPEHLEMLRKVGFTSAMVIPLTSRGRILGIISFIYSEQGRHYNDDDLHLAERLAHRAAFAVDNALLYREAQEELAERTQAQQEVEELNEQLRIAMTETHHRVKNNLQIMAAMVDMQAMEAIEADGSVPVTELRRLNRHIRTLAVIHDLLTQKAREDGRAEELSARAILEQLLPMLQQTAGTQTIDFSAEDAPLTSRQGTSLALVTNELISNALKYGQNQIEVRFTVREGRATLEICDDGPGFPPDFDPAKASNTGLELVENLSRWDLSGRSVYFNGSSGGACARVEFPVGGESLRSL